MTLSIFLVQLNSFAVTGKCEKISTPSWVEREIKKALDGTPKSESVQNTFPANIDGKNLTLHYIKYPATTTPSKGTILFLCGGPGVPCNLGGRPYTMPGGYDILVMDYLGVGENKKANKPAMMSIDSQASAASQLVKYLKPKNFVIYGESFGTTVATATAAKLTSVSNKNKNSFVKGVLLEGVVGKGDYAGYSVSFADAANTAWNLLNSSEKEKFKSFYIETAKKLNADELKAFNGNLAKSLVEGSLSAVKYLKSISSSSIDEVKQNIKIPMMWSQVLSTGDSLNQIRAAGCQIFAASQDQAEQKIFDSTVTLITPIPQGTCDCKTLAKVWNPDEYQIMGIPVIYINGRQDPNTAYQWAKTHFDGQISSSDKVLLSTTYGGHNELGEAPLKTCPDAFFDSLVAQDLSSINANKEAILKNGCSGSSNSSLLPPQSGVR